MGDYVYVFVSFKLKVCIFDIVRVLKVYLAWLLFLEFLMFMLQFWGWTFVVWRLCCWYCWCCNYCKN